MVNIRTLSDAERSALPLRERIAYDQARGGSAATDPTSDHYRAGVQSHAQIRSLNEGYDWATSAATPREERPQQPVADMTAFNQQMAALSAQMGQQSAAYQGQINDLMRRMEAEQRESKAAQQEYQRKLQQEMQARGELDARIQHYTSPEFMTEGAELAREHMRPGQEIDQARIMEAIVKGAEQRGMVHSGITPGLQQRAAQHLEEQYAKKGMEIAQQLALMGVRGAEGEWDRLLQGLEMEGGALTGGQAMSWGQLADQMGFAQTGQQNAAQQALQQAMLGQRGSEFAQTHALQQFQSMAPYMLMTQAEQASHVRQLLQQMGVPTGNLSDAELQNIYQSLSEGRGGF